MHSKAAFTWSLQRFMAVVDNSPASSNCRATQGGSVDNSTDFRTAELLRDGVPLAVDRDP